MAEVPRKGYAKNPQVRNVGVRMQFVRTDLLDIDPNGSQSVGQIVDDTLTRAYAKGEYPNKLVLEINPRLDHPEDMS